MAPPLVRELVLPLTSPQRYGADGGMGPALLLWHCLGEGKSHGGDGVGMGKMSTIGYMM